MGLRTALGLKRPYRERLGGSVLSTTGDLYVDLLIRTLTNSIYGDPSIAPWQNQDDFIDQQREVGADWPRSAHTMVGRRRLKNLAELVGRTIDDRIPGDYIETGVWRGGCCIMMRAMLAYKGRAGSKVFVADSFEGLPPPSDGITPDVGDIHHTFDELRVSQEEVAANFTKYGLLDDRVVFLKGWFKDTLPKLKTNKFALLRLDGDMYESTMDALVALYPKLSPGGFIIIDDYGCVPACKQAVTDYRMQHGIREKIVDVDWSGVYWQKIK